MTTICYRGGFLAADTLVTCGGTVLGHATKVAVTPSGLLVGAAGTAGYCQRVMDWAVDEDGDIPLPKSDESQLLIIDNDNQITLVDAGGSFEIESDYISIGSGSDHALAVLAMGGSAMRAVEIASQLDIYTGGEVTFVRRPRRRRADR